jgi:hypothetical protein
MVAWDAPSGGSEGKRMAASPATWIEFKWVIAAAQTVQSNLWQLATQGATARISVTGFYDALFGVVGVICGLLVYFDLAKAERGWRRHVARVGGACLTLLSVLALASGVLLVAGVST